MLYQREVIFMDIASKVGSISAHTDLIYSTDSFILSGFIFMYPTVRGYHGSEPKL